MNEKKKRNIIICSLCGILLLMAVGYAAFNTILTINGTASITSNWDIKITNITEGTKVGDASSAEDPTYEDLTATFSTNLVSPEDSIEYNVTVENQGSLNAQLEKININKQISSAINITYSGIEAGEILNSGSDITFTIKVEYNPSITSQPKDTTSTFKMTLDYVEEGKAGDPSTSTTGTLTMGGQTVSVIDDGSDGLYEDPVEPGRYVYAGAKPNNYITFNGETWRIISVETDGTIKIMRNNATTKMAFDSKGKRDSASNEVGGTYCAQSGEGCNAWAKTTGEYASGNGSYKGTVLLDSEIKAYLNGTYYDSISKNKSAIANHAWYYGSPTWESTILSEMVEKEKTHNATSYIGLIQGSDYIKSNTNTEQCGTHSLVSSNYNTCKSTTWMVQSDWYWSLSPDGNHMDVVIRVNTSGALGSCGAGDSGGSVVPSLYLKSDVELEGQGTEGEPYTITNYAN